MCFIDLDAFKPINDRLGHEAGDRVLIETGERLRRTLRGADSVARIGGDEFALLIEDAADVGEDLLPLLERCLSAISQPIAIGEHRVVVS
ncbi:GGDEF domain-containing protein, partial [Arthrospira platensis SPKY1]|nr:GGDEF domain-containing protein [Arthrospira platensis SPKY1]